jgi:2-hydroxychromene-2-carboxylate isomerase
MAPVIDYYFATISPWTWLGHDRFAALARAHGAAVRVRPVDFGRVFAASGGLPLPKRAPQRQAYRLVELQRWSGFLGVPLNLHPKHFPVPGDASARLILAVAQHDGEDAALALTGRVLRAVWVDERDISNPDHLALLLAEAGLPARRLGDAAEPAVQARYDALTQQAVDAHVFGAPSYVVDDEIFWGQDRLDFLARRLAEG